MQNFPLINILTDGGIGGNFITWSLYYLSGQTEYLHTKTNTVKPLPDNPLTSQNAHGWESNQYQDPELIYKLQKLPTDRLNVIYHHTLGDRHAEHIQAVITHLTNMTNKNVICTNTSSRVRFWNVIGRTGRPMHSVGSKEWIDEWFGRSLNEWSKDSNFDLNNPWDLREFMALNFGKHGAKDNKLNISKYITKYNKDFFYTNISECWHMLDTLMKDIISWAGLELDSNRLDTWRPVYASWRDKTRNIFLFDWYFDEIINAILKNNYINLTRYNLTLIHESVILNELIYTHNLNIKSYGVDRFIDTQQVHNMLEPNLHNSVNN